MIKPHKKDQCSLMGEISKVSEHVEGIGNVAEEQEEDMPRFSCPIESSLSSLSFLLSLLL